ncbi:Hypothetical_protein [Hexamita inflata]|uniref:Hypothetical_protein n=1 Tax=Hexamita inflata TaxID=28002 RepID=A0AA86U633_9EUKA|nr:Hypothetical protein HINF_LOCUS31881 [Hexamita inflata]CAI9944239.1 Hypothetical protein HINF_LOCUS31884 [Hexamita inflata]CAI9944243.1 Hypothetical protein HINF_LOCUS31888 [Hexamita inflata]CAI9944245.1 Hypothetical protein HINF_LOCUS31890 [Hexamita inflata]
MPYVVLFGNAIQSLLSTKKYSYKLSKLFESRKFIIFKTGEQEVQLDLGHGTRAQIVSLKPETHSLNSAALLQNLNIQFVLSETREKRLEICEMWSVQQLSQQEIY